MKTFFALLVLLLSAFALAANHYRERFDTAWELIRDRYWDKAYNGLDWQEIRRSYEPKALAADSDEAFYGILDDMYQELNDNHSRFLSPQAAEELRQTYGDLPCVGVFSFAQSQSARQSGRVSFELLEGNIGYLRLPDLVGTTANLRTAVRGLKRRAKGFILDLRGNPGGQNIEMMQAAGIFTSGFLWRVIARWTFPFPQPAIGSIETDLPLVVLIDKEVNSAAEGLAGALQAKGRATIVGETSAGNVEAVLPFCFRDGSMAYVATGVLAPLRDPTWEGRGVTPDIATDPDSALDTALDYLTKP